MLPKREVRLLNDLTIEERQDYLLDMSLVGDAMMKALNPTKVNYEILGNKDYFLHAHLFPRYEWENESVKYMPVWAYDASNWSNEETAYDPDKHDEIRNKIKNKLEQLYKI